MSTSAEKREIDRYKREIEAMEEKWSKNMTDWEDYQFRKYNFDDVFYDELYKKHQQNLRKIRRRRNPLKVTLWDFIYVQKK